MSIARRVVFCVRNGTNLTHTMLALICDFQSLDCPLGTTPLSFPAIRVCISWRPLRPHVRAQTSACATRRRTGTALVRPQTASVGHAQETTWCCVLASNNDASTYFFRTGARLCPRYEFTIPADARGTAALEGILARDRQLHTTTQASTLAPKLRQRQYLNA